MPLVVACEREGRSLGGLQRADAALAEGEIVGAACGGVRDCDEIDGEAAQLVDSVCGLGHEWGRELRSG